MKVIHILHSLKYSGAEIMYVDAAHLFQEKGCEISVVATANDLGEFAPKFKDAGYELFHKPYPSKINFFKKILYYYKFVTFLKKENYDVVHIHASGTMWGMALCAWLAGKKSIYTFHNVFPTRPLTRPYHIFLRWTAKNWFNCKFQTISDSVYNNELITFKNKTTKINNWYGSNRYFPANENEKARFREEMGFDKNVLVIVSVGGCSHVKRHTDIIKALALVVKQIPDCFYLHLGEGYLENEEQKLAEQLDIKDNIHFLGNQSDVRKFLIASDIYVMSSKFEGLPITTIEAMACGIPTILYDVPGLRDFNKTVKTSTLIKEDYKTLAHSIINFYKNKAPMAQLAATAKQFVDDNYSMRINSEKIFQLYKLDDSN